MGTMGNSFGDLSSERAKELEDQYEEACERAARAIIDADVSTICCASIGDLHWPLSVARDWRRVV